MCTDVHTNLFFLKINTPHEFNSIRPSLIEGGKLQAGGWNQFQSL